LFVHTNATNIVNTKLCKKKSDKIWSSSWSQLTELFI